MSQHRPSKSLLGEYPAMQQPPLLDSVAGSKNFHESRRMPLLPAGPPVETTPQSSRQPILFESIAAPFLNAIPPKGDFSSELRQPSILDRAVGLLDRTPNEKQQSMMQSHSRIPLLLKPGLEGNRETPTMPAIISTVESTSYHRRGLLDRSRSTTSPHSVSSAASPPSGRHEDDRPNKFASPEHCVVASLIEPVPAGFLDRDKPLPNGQRGVDVDCRQNGFALDRSRSPVARGRRSNRNRRRSRSPQYRQHDLRSRTKKRSPSPRNRRSTASDKRRDETTATSDRRSLLDRSSEERRIDSSIQAASVQQNPTVASSAESSDLRDKDERQQNQPAAGKMKSDEDPTEKATSDEQQHPCTPTGYRRMAVMVSKLSELELKLTKNWRFCKFLAESPRVRIDRLPNEVVEKALNGQYHTGETATMKKAKIGKPEDEEIDSPLVDDKATARKSVVKRKRTQAVEPEAIPFLNIPGMPSRESLWNFKIKKKPPVEKKMEERDVKKESPVGLSRQMQLESVGTLAKSVTSNALGRSNQLQKKDVDVLSSILEYSSPLMRMENESAKRRREEQKEAKETRPRAPPTAPTMPKPKPLFSLTVGTNAAENIDSQIPPQPATTLQTVSPSLSSSSHSSFRHNDGVSSRGLTPPPAIFTAQPKRRTLLGQAPLLPSPVGGPHTPPEATVSEIAAPVKAMPAEIVVPAKAMPSESAAPAKRRNVPLLGEQPPSLPNWTPDPPRNGPYERKVPAYCEDNMESEQIEFNESPKSVNPDGTPFDPMIFLNRCSDYSSDGETPAQAPDTFTADNRCNEFDQHQPVDQDDHSQVESAQRLEFIYEPQPVETLAPIEEEEAPTTSNVSLDSEAAMADLALKLLEGEAAIDQETATKLVSSFNSMRNSDEDDDEDAYDVSQLRNNIRMLLDDRTSVLQSDPGRRRKAMELLPVLDELETLARLRSSALTQDMLLPIMRFVYEVVELSTPSSNFGVAASTEK